MLLQSKMRNLTKLNTEKCGECSFLVMETGWSLLLLKCAEDGKVKP